MDAQIRNPSHMSASQRSIALDVLKGIGCAMMVIPHTGLNIHGYERFRIWGILAPVLFYAVSAITASFQAHKYPPRSFFLTYAFLFLLGFSFNRITDPGFLNEIEFDILQFIAVGSCIIYLLERYLRPSQWVYLVLGFASAAAKPLIQSALDGAAFPGANLIVPPGIFPIFPWMFLFFLGLFCWRAENRFNLGLGIGSTLALIGLWLSGYPLDIQNKEDMSLSVFLLCCSMLFLSFYLARALPKLFNNKRLMAPLSFLGRNSLLYLYVHFPTILLLKHFRIVHRIEFINTHPYLIWALALALTYLIMFALLPLGRIGWLARVFDFIPTWVVMVALVFGAGFFIPNIYIVQLAEVLLGLVIAIFFHRLASTLKKQPLPSTTPDP
ncbi:MAG: hypothetical protein HFACDABA_01672 [Anaerolineales bacterium]|nr:hypothetical protein [Anaerolineales bacterium]